MHRITLWGAGVITGAMFLAMPFTAGAVSLIDLQNQLSSLVKQIAQMQLQTSVSASGSATASSAVSSPVQYRICGILNRNLSIGTRGDDVSGLQELLQAQGYLSVSPTGYYGPVTAQAVAKWQSAEGVSAVGAFGPMSRERMRVRCGGPGNTERFSASPTSGSAPLGVTFDTWLSGFRLNTISYALDYGDGSSERAADCNAPADACISPGVNTHTYTSDGTYTATLNKITDPCAGNPACKAAIQTEVVAKLQITVGSASCKPINYMPVLCADGSSPQPKHNESGCIIGYECPVANYTPPISCKAWNDGCNECGRTSPTAPAACTMRACFAAGKGYCSVYFDNPTSGNQPPVLSGLSGPTTLSVGQTGTWNVNASDPENGTLSYSITWGDETTYAPMTAGVSANNIFVQNTTFTHTYSSVGTFTITITVRDNAGQSAQTTTTVQVGGSVVCTTDYSPVCGQPPGPKCSAGMMCPMYMPAPTTYSNRCMLNAAGATFLYSGACTNGVTAY